MPRSNRSPTRARARTGKPGTEPSDGVSGCRVLLVRGKGEEPTEPSTGGGRDDGCSRQPLASSLDSLVERSSYRSLLHARAKRQAEREAFCTLVGLQPWPSSRAVVGERADPRGCNSHGSEGTEGNSSWIVVVSPSLPRACSRSSASSSPRRSSSSTRCPSRRCADRVEVAPPFARAGSNA